MINKVHQGDFLTNTLPNKSVQLIIADPPYFEVKGEFDFIWSSMDDYLVDVEKWAIECKRLLADNGTLFWWGHAKKIAYSQITLDKFFNLENSLVWEKNAQPKKCNADMMRTFAPITERCLMYSNEIERTGLEEIKLDINNFPTMRNYFKELQNWIGCGKKKIIERIGQKADHCFRWGSTQWDLPTEETYNELIKAFNIDQWSGFKEYETLRQEYETLRQEYETLRQEYEALRRPFNQSITQTDVLKYDQESHITKQYNHPTKKPEKLTSALITTCSRPNDLVFVPFSGSGTECAMAAKYGRNFIGFDIEQKYVDMVNKRCKPFLTQSKLF